MHLSEGLMHEEVIDLAVQIHSALSVITSRHSGDAIVDVVPHLVNALNRLDACLKVNDDLQTSLMEISTENSLLIKKLDDEKQKRTLCFEETLNIEEQAESEINNLRVQVEDLVKTKINLRSELMEKDAIISLLKADCAEMNAELNNLNRKENINREQHIITDDSNFITPKKTIKQRIKSKENHCTVEIDENRFSVLSTNMPTVESTRMTSLLELNQRTNILVCSVPYRYDDPTLNENILNSNSYLSRVVRNYKGGLQLQYRDINDFLERSHFTRHGLHFSRKGKKVLVGHLAGCIEQTLRVCASACSNSSETEVPQRGLDNLKPPKNG
ncbi:hypothetical protein LSTR_LSTR007319 [Laodelphax striatellus]|uniref:RH1 domain-containing protein n=1 Tax=Laodelphax striatellus TaxID=195883 RepID=A0A482WTJ8_LAOST|nr:hypothetical protein LSTR_LSTR007319 [Laodelphax striatellus]